MNVFHLVILPIALAISFSSNAQSIEKNADPLKGVKRWGSIPIAKDEVFLAIPDGFPIAASLESNKPGLYQVWFYPDGQSKENWRDTLHLMAFPSIPKGNDSPAKQMLNIISQPIKAACPNDFFSEPKVQKESTRASAIMGCRKVGGGLPTAIFGYYLAIQSAEGMYVIAREFRQTPFEGELPIAQSTQSQWQGLVNRTTICHRNEMCIK